MKRVRGWLEDMLPDDEKEEDDGGTAESGKETSVIVNQLACKEVGCPDVEVVMTLLRAKPRPKLMFKLYKAAADLTNDEVGTALRTALAEEKGEAHEADHDHGHADSGHDGCQDPDCNHDHQDGQPQDTDKQHEHDH